MLLTDRKSSERNRVRMLLFYCQRGTFRSVRGCGKKRSMKHLTKERRIVHGVFVEFVRQSHLGSLGLDQVQIRNAMLVDLPNHKRE